MVKKFFLSVLSSFVGAWLAIVLSGFVIVIIVIAMIGGMVGDSSKSSFTENSVLRINLSGVLVERNVASSEINLQDLLTGDSQQTNSVEALQTAIKEAAKNKKIKAIYIDCGSISGGLASLHQVRISLLQFKKSGKKIYAYADQMSQAAYYVASVANEICLNPAGELSLNGLGGEVMFYKGLFDKLGIEFDVVRVGEGKSAVEPYMSESMSEYARNQSLALLNGLWGVVKDGLASSRQIKNSQIDTLINNDYIQCKPAKFALEQKLVDKLEYRHAFESYIAIKSGQGEKLESTVSPEELLTLSGLDNMLKDTGSNQIAVLYACGAIDDVIGGYGINSSDMVENILQLADKDEVKGLVLRVNSPGGSAFGSEQIWEAVQTFKKTGKPCAVSMGDYAASGGYYISCGADKIFADSLTVTGSIGIFGLIPNIQKLTDKIGLHAELVATNPNGQFPSALSALTPQQHDALQGMVEDGYDLFVNRCSKGRKIPLIKIKEIADGRPIDAITAKQLGLVDELASLQKAIEWTATKAKVKNYDTIVYPDVELTFLSMLGSISTMTKYMSLMSETDTDWTNRVLNIYDKIMSIDKTRASMPPIRLKL